eukprot:363811-Chlamydomonas_euryale.AAC.7
MCDGRMAFADAVPLLPARARAAVAELLTRGLDHATAKALATDLSAVLRPYTQGADARPRKLIADALSLVSLETWRAPHHSGPHHVRLPAGPPRIPPGMPHSSNTAPARPWRPSTRVHTPC